MAFKVEKMEVQVMMECGAEKLFEMFTAKRNEIPKLTPRITYTDAQPDDWKCALPPIRRWDFVIDGKSAYITERISVDKEKREVCNTIMDGDVMKNKCKKLGMKLQIGEMEGEGRHCCVKWSFEYEKLNEAALAPFMELEFMLNFTKDIATCLANA